MTEQQIVSAYHIRLRKDNNTRENSQPLILNFYIESAKNCR